MTPELRTAVCGAASLALATPLLLAQAPATVPVSVPAEKTVELAPFVVNTDKDTGYVANDVATGGRLNTNLLETPADVSILTRDFLDDIGVFSLNDAFAWLPNSDYTDPGSDPDFGSNASFRGLSGATNTRNNVRFGTTVEEYAVDRMEGNRGPSGVLFGDGAAGGQLNITTKQAKFRNFNSLNLRVDSLGSVRSVADLNRKVSDKVAARINLLAQRRKTWLDRSFDDRYGVTAAITLQPYKDTQIRFDGSYDYAKYSSSSYIFIDQSSNWDRVTGISAPLTVNPPTSSGISRFTTDKLVFSPAWGNTIMNFRNFGRTNGTGLNLVEDGTRTFANFPVLPRREFQIRPNEFYSANRYYIASLTFEQKIGDLVIELSALTHAVWRLRNNVGGGNQHYIDVNRVLPDGRPNPKFGQPFSEGGWTVVLQDEFMENFRAAAAYPLRLKSFTQIFGVTLEKRAKIFDPESYTLGRNNGPIANVRDANNTLVYWRYWDDPGADYVHTPPGASRDGYAFSSNVTRDNNTRDDLESLHLTTVGHYFKRRITVVAGVRFDNFKSDQRNALTYTPQGTVATNRVTSFDNNARVRSLGGTYFVTRALGVYANWSEGFFPNYNLSPAIGERGPIYVSTSIGKSAGLRFNLRDRLLIGSLGFYQTQEKDRQIVAPFGPINQIWADLNLIERQVATNTGNVLDTQDYEARGWELDLTVNLAKSFRLKFNVALPETEQINTLPDYQTYVAENIALWNSGADDPANPNRVRIANNIASVQDTVRNAGDGRPTYRTYKWRSNIFGVYQFPGDGPLRGLSVGGGANFFGKQLIGAPAGDPNGLIYGKEYYVVTGTIGYNFKLRKTPVRLNLSLQNLLDYDEPVYRAVTTYQGVTYRNGFTYVAPRQATLTAVFGL